MKMLTVTALTKMIKNKKLLVSKQGTNLLFHFVNDQDADDILFMEYGSISDKDEKLTQLFSNLLSGKINVKNLINNP
jgi:hypothetical protein